MGEESSDDTSSTIGKTITLITVVVLSLAIVVSITYIMFGTTTSPDAHELNEIVAIDTNGEETIIELTGTAPDGYIFADVVESNESADLRTRGEQAILDTESNQTIQFTYRETTDGELESETKLGEYDI